MQDMNFGGMDFSKLGLGDDDDNFDINEENDRAGCILEGKHALNYTSVQEVLKLLRKSRCPLADCFSPVP